MLTNKKIIKPLAEDRINIKPVRRSVLRPKATSRMLEGKHFLVTLSPEKMLASAKRKISSSLISLQSTCNRTLCN